MRITLATGREVSLSRIDQWRTYGGLLCGRPDERTNRLFVEELLERDDSDRRAHRRADPEGGLGAPRAGLVLVAGGLLGGGSGV